MQTITKRKWLKASTAIALLLPIALVTGCGGGGGGTSSNTARVGTYSGSYNFPSSGGTAEDNVGVAGTFILRVQTDGQATGTFNEDDPARTVVSTGTVSLSSGKLALSNTNFDNGGGDMGSVTLSGQVTNTGATGSVVLTDKNGNTSATFTTTKTSTSVLPVATPVPSALVKRDGHIVRKIGRN
jgi:hypothetical protein